MDRVQVWSGAQARAVDLLLSERNTMIALAKLTEMLLGTGTLVAGLSCVPTSPASMSVQVNAGQIFSLQNLDSTAFSSLPLDNTHQIVKQGIMLDAVALGCAAPGTSGQSINYLVQAAFQEVDGGSTVLSYYNSANPTSPYSGPSNSGAANYTLRQDQCVVTVKAGTAATTGSQTTPAPDSGNVGLWVVTVANGASTITSGNINAYSGAPTTIPKLQTIPAAIQDNGYSWGGSAGGSANSLTASISPTPTLTAGLNVLVKATAANTGAATLNLNGLGAVNILNVDGSALVANEITSGMILDLLYDGTEFILLNGNATAAAIGNLMGGSIVSPGYKKFPDGSIVQGGQTTLTSGQTVTVAYPVSFNSSAAWCATAISGLSASALYPPNINLFNSPADSGHFTISNPNSSTVQFNWIIFGK